MYFQVFILSDFWVYCIIGVELYFLTDEALILSMPGQLPEEKGAGNTNQIQKISFPGLVLRSYVDLIKTELKTI